MTSKVTKGKYKPSVVDPLNQRAMRILNGTANFKDRFFPKHNELVGVITMLRSMGCVIAFTSGVWDLLHVGHSRYIQQGKDQACKLYPNAERVIMVVGIDTDAFTRSRKGPTRPLVSEDERSEMLYYQRAVDIIVPQYEADQLYQLVEHDVRVISVSTKDLPNQQKIKRFCKHLVNLPPQAEVSTTIRVRDIMLDGRREQITQLKQRLIDVVEGFENELKKV